MPRDFADIWLRLPTELRTLAVDHQNRIEMHAPAWTRERLAEAMRLPLHEVHGAGGRFWLYYHEPYHVRVEMKHYGD